MKRNVLFILFIFTFSITVFAQEVRMRDVFAQMPDSILPMITKNNRLDCIDFIENNMPAQVKNMVDEPIELVALTDDYLKLVMSKVSQAEMKLLKASDTTLVVCMVRTYEGPVKDSSIDFYTTDWQRLKTLTVTEPAIEDYFPDVPEGEGDMKRDVLAMLRDMPFRTMELSAGGDEITFRLQTGELMKKEREWADKYVKPLKVKVL